MMALILSVGECAFLKKKKKGTREALVLRYERYIRTSNCVDVGRWTELGDDGS